MVSLCLGMLKCVISRCVQEETVHVLLLDSLQACVGGIKADDSQNCSTSWGKAFAIVSPLWFILFFFLMCFKLIFGLGIFCFLGFARVGFLSFLCMC